MKKMSSLAQGWDEKLGGQTRTNPQTQKGELDLVLVLHGSPSIAALRTHSCLLTCLCSKRQHLKDTHAFTSPWV